MNNLRYTVLNGRNVYHLSFSDSISVLSFCGKIDFRFTEATTQNEKPEGRCCKICNQALKRYNYIESHVDKLVKNHEESNANQARL